MLAGDEFNRDRAAGPPGEHKVPARGAAEEPTRRDVAPYTARNTANPTLLGDVELVTARIEIEVKVAAPTTRLRRFMITVGGPSIGRSLLVVTL